MCCTSFLVHGPIGSIFTKSMTISHSMRALLLCTEICGTVTLTTFFFNTVEGPPNKKSDSACSAECKNDCLAYQLGRFAAIALVSSILASVPIGILASLHSRTFKHVADEKQLNFQLGRWKRRDRFVYVFGTCYCLFCLNFVALFFANVQTPSIIDWGKAIAMTLGQDLLLSPFLGSAIAPCMAYSVLTCVSCFRCTKKREFVTDGRKTMMDWFGWGDHEEEEGDGDADEAEGEDNEGGRSDQEVQRPEGGGVRSLGEIIPGCVPDTPDECDLMVSPVSPLAPTPCEKEPPPMCEDQEVMDWSPQETWQLPPDMISLYTNSYVEEEEV
jgi:hypothetical protein